MPLTGADVDLWGEQDVNPNMVAIDGLFGGVQTINLSNVNVTLTKPAGFTPTPSPGPTQSQNAVLNLTGALTASVQLTLPLPGRYIVDNRTTGNFVVQLLSTAPGEIIALPPGSVHTVYNNGVDVRFVDLGKVGDMEFWAGLTALPLWANSCTVPPYLYCDRTVYNVSQFPYLGARLSGTFGGNGATTFGVPDLRGRFPLAYDGTGARVTAAQCGINGTLGAEMDAQSVTLVQANMPSHYHVAGIYDPSHLHSATTNTSSGSGVTGGGGFPLNVNVTPTNTGAALTGVRVNSSNGIDTTYSTGGGGTHNNMPNTQVAGIWVLKT